MAEELGAGVDTRFLAAFSCQLSCSTAVGRVSSHLLFLQRKIEDLLRRRNEMLEQDMGVLSSCSTVDNLEEYEMRISDAYRKMGTTRKKFERLRTVCISAEQGLKSMLDRVRIALQEVTAAELMPVSKIPQGTPPRPGKKPDCRERYAHNEPPCMTCFMQATGCSA
jgi:hypothetical protein